MPDNNNDNVDSTEFDHNDGIQYSDQDSQLKPNKPPVWAWAALGGLSIVALLVIFVLPSIVSEYELPLERRVETAVVQPREAALIAISPFEEAQRSIQRKEAQDVLADLLAKQAELESLEVSSWAGPAYDIALERASIGDDYYRTQDFILARESYEAGRDDLIALIDSSPTVLAQTLVDAQQALIGNDAATALDKFSLALLFEPDNEIAQIGQQRALSLDEVSGLLSEAEELADDGELEQARTIYLQILDLDNYNDVAQEQIQLVSQQITDNEFARIMSSGYALLESGEAEQAIEVFQRAANLGVKQNQAIAAITQTENEIANAEINQIRSLITISESDEKWQTAVDEYDEVLAIDSNLLFAINGRDYAGKRAQLDQLLVGALANPERFSETVVFEQTLDVYYTGRAIENPGPHLTGQLDELEVFLENSQVPIDIQLVSDNLTDVTLLRVGSLGNFERTAVALKPGRYVAVGKRTGYREVREEFTVGFGLTPSSVIVQCDERIGASNGR
ncbi:MAG: hypothetical protein COA96_07450 [SAR86 cluster bacterium]|uniref:Uncharacterized protein n=1 Tax=SAR86 cluster bacterium TaxID=2030880 RepID=A0A2A5B2A1_9GAMM|nr:MAG: hypothetical protein COA96_07450 [SAR86 cluster bacterium]